MIYHQAPDCTFSLGDVRECLDALPEKSVQCVMTSPPYFRLRKYAGVEPTVWGGSTDCDHDWQTRDEYHNRGDSSAGAKQKTNLGAVTGRGVIQEATCRHCSAWLGCLGLEPTPALFIEHLVDVFRAVKRVLRDDGVCFVNLGDSYTGSGKGPTGQDGIGDAKRRQGFVGPNENMDGYFRGRQENGGGRRNHGLAGKNLLLIPQRFAIAAQDDGWIVRSMIVWSKKSCMPESVTDRPTSAHEVIWMFTKRERYFWDSQAVREQGGEGWHNSSFESDYDEATKPGLGRAPRVEASGRNLRNVWLDPDDRGSDFWHLGPEPFKDAHFATFPTAIPRRCILAASREGDTVLDCFGGSGTTQVVARELGRRSIYIDASREYADMAIKRYEATPVALPMVRSTSDEAEQLSLEGAS